MIPYHEEMHSLQFISLEIIISEMLKMFFQYHMLLVWLSAAALARLSYGSKFQWPGCKK